ncbi:5'-nucleotidase /3'-nucleotidase /exopolyphosphatase [Halogranum gelatinilyticum]|uniref:5'-nucleotidase SurE n=1 Tax=Halogranum gelatinilyticum TaxID=660521 RepID=A0A1G9P698_9EURY|nr:5'/3'-nucleotidase SurE [Halogranum gelatinilyticum]SDL94260.1 5'-nucleotidase /3'-nucleotidase /exopolyphosphatase [Halogranum gelatinilyticum]
MSEPHVLLTNDDGIDSPALRALRDELASVCDVTVVAPATNQSGVGRARSRTVAVEERDDGYAVEGTPADCVAYGLRQFDDSPDLVVSGANVGPNVGSYVLGRSGTVGAAVEAGFLGTPGLAVSAYCSEGFFPADDADYDGPARVTRDLVEEYLEGELLSRADFLNVNAPLYDADRMRVTTPFADFDTGVERLDGEETGDDVELRDAFWAQADAGYWEQAEAGGDLFDHIEPHRHAYPVGSDRRAILDGEVSVSPLSVPQSVVQSAAVDDAVARYNGERVVDGPQI